MKKALITMMCLASMLAAGTGLKAQTITVDLGPGYNWISYPNAEAMPIDAALGGFTPADGDIIRSQFGGSSRYLNGRWRGSMTHFIPGWGYQYYSARSENVEFVFAQPASNVVTTDEPTDITLTSAVVGGTVTLPEGSQVFLRGVCWGTEPSPDIDGDHTTEETGIGIFSSTLEGLTPNTTYYLRAYVIYDHGLSYGNELSFTTLSGIPTVNTAEVTDITATTATCGGTVTDGGGLDIIARGVCWSTSHNPTLSNNHTSDGTGTGSFGSSLITLLPNTTYYVRAYATTAQATSYGEEMTFTTMNGIPSVSTAEVTDVTATTATCGGMVIDDGGLDITARGVCWSTSSNPTIVDAHSTDGTGTGNFSSTLTGLTPNTTYFVRAYATNSYVTVYGNQRSFTTAPLPSCTVSVTCNPTEGGTITGGGTYEQGQSCTLTATANEGYTFANWTENGSQVSTNATYTFTVNADRTLVANFIQGGSGGDHAYVDLGLPSGLLWATCNVGADNPEDYGDYFAWGETQPKDTYNWSTYQYCNGNYNTLTKYCNDSYNGYNGFTDNLTTLLPEDDAATANWGSDWRMPTKEEWQELYNNTTHTWTTQNGVDGRLFTASNGNSIFLPAAGYRYNSNLSSAGLTGYYWSSSLYPNDPNGAWYFYFNSDRYYMDYYNRSYGRSVRAVRVGSQTTSFSIDATTNPSEGGIVAGTGNYAEGSTCTLIATANEGYTFANWTENGSQVSTNATYTFTVSADRTLVANFTYNGGGDHAYVDLGLPSGLLWATCNVGADAPEDYGDYFAWGETQPKNKYNWSTYQYCMGSNSTMTKYCNNSSYGYNGFTDNLTTLLPEDDAATANWGSEWRMPTKEEFQELLDNTTVTWTTQNGVNGRLFTAPNGNSLFLPAAGNRVSTSLSGTGGYGYYWSSTLDTGSPHVAWNFGFYSDGFSMAGNYRYYGLSVRGVRSSRQN